MIIKTWRFYLRNKWLLNTVLDELKKFYWPSPGHAKFRLPCLNDVNKCPCSSSIQAHYSSQEVQRLCFFLRKAWRCDFLVFGLVKNQNGGKWIHNVNINRACRGIEFIHRSCRKLFWWLEIARVSSRVQLPVGVIKRWIHVALKSDYRSVSPTIENRKTTKRTNFP